LYKLSGTCLNIQPPIAPAAAQKIQRKAQILLLLNWSAPGYYCVLTAKLGDYLAAGRPMQTLVNGSENQELKGIIEGANAGAVFTDEEQEKLVQWIDKK
jgi:hypothetical protein